MSIEVDCPLAPELGEELRGRSKQLVGRWLVRIRDRVSIDSNTIFPSRELLDHMPILIDGIAGYLEDPADEVSADVPVVAKAMDLGELRHEQGFDAHEILKEYEILGGILFTFLMRVVENSDTPCSRSQLLACAHRLFRAIAIIQEVTMTQYLRVAEQRVGEREERLRGFNRALSHEIKDSVGAIGNAVAMLGEDFVLDDDEQRERFRRMASENTRRIDRTIGNLIELSRTEHDARQRKNVLLRDAAAEAVRQLRDFAEARGVEVRIADELPRIEVPASVVELALSNYVSNAIKYHDPDADERRVDVSARLSDADDPDDLEVIVEVADNGIGVPGEARDRLFRRFARGHDKRAAEVEGTGLGLSIVKDTIESVGGRVWADFSRDEVTVFSFALPCRRSADRAGADGSAPDD